MQYVSMEYVTVSLEIILVKTVIWEQFSYSPSSFDQPEAYA